MMTIKKILLTATLLFSAGAATAGITSDQLVAAFQAQGFTAVEVKSGPTQFRVEAVRKEMKLEVVYDRETGQILSQERSRATRGEANGGWEFSNSQDDFTGNDDNGNDDSGWDDNGNDDSGWDDNGSDDGGSDDSDDNGSDDDRGGDRNDDRGGDRNDD